MHSSVIIGLWIYYENEGDVVEESGGIVVLVLSVLDYAPVLLVSTDFVQVVFTGHNSEDVKVSNTVLNGINDNIYKL